MGMLIKSLAIRIAGFPFDEEFSLIIKFSIYSMFEAINKTIRDSHFLETNKPAGANTRIFQAK